MTEVHGEVAAGFEPVQEQFEYNFAKRGELGAAFTAYVHGVRVVDLWGGMADPSTGRQWDAETLCTIDSTTKSLTATCVLHLLQRGQIDLDALVTDYWPEFGANGKSATTVVQLLSHQAGVPAIDGWITLADCAAWDPLVEALQEQRPFWEPGAAHGYHGLTFGWLAGELVRRVSGLRPGEYLAQHIAGPLGLDMWIGLPDGLFARVAPIVRPEWDEGVSGALPEDDPFEASREVFQELTAVYGDPAYVQMLFEPSNRTPDSSQLFQTLAQRAFGPVEFGLHLPFDERFLAMDVPAANAVTSAASLAKLYASMISDVDGGRVLAPSTVDAARAVRTRGRDLVMHYRNAWGLGFMVPGGPGEESFRYETGSLGFLGGSGALGLADPDRGIAVGYVRNRMQLVQHDGRDDLVSAVYRCAS